MYLSFGEGYQSLPFKPASPSFIQRKKYIIHWGGGWGILSAGFLFSSTKEAACIHPLVQLPYRCLCVCWQVSDSFAIPRTVAPQAPLSMGFSRQEYWSGLQFPSPGDLLHSGIETAFFASPALAGRFFTAVLPGKPWVQIYNTIYLTNCMVTLGAWNLEEIIKTIL